MSIVRTIGKTNQQSRVEKAIDYLIDELERTDYNLRIKIIEELIIKLNDLAKKSN